MPVSTPPAAQAPVLEVFASFQGEGLYVGCPQVFLRMAGCPLRCAWCDTPGSWTISTGASAVIRTSAGEREEGAWATPEVVAAWIDEVDPTERMTVSVTGGEPLMWAEFLLELRPLLKRRRVHLETAGAHPLALSRVLDACDHVSTDLKLPADMGAPQAVGFPEVEASPRTSTEWRTARRAVLELISDRDACAKVIVAGGREARDFAEIVVDVLHCAPNLTLIVQPVTPSLGVQGPTQEALGGVVLAARQVGLDARVIGQLHPAWELP